MLYEELAQMARDQSKMEELEKELYKLRLENEILVKEKKLLKCLSAYFGGIGQEGYEFGWRVDGQGVEDGKERDIQGGPGSMYVWAS